MIHKLYGSCHSTCMLLYTYICVFIQNINYMAMAFQYCSTECIYFQSLCDSYVKQCIVCTYFCTHSCVSCMLKNRQWRLNIFLCALICIIALFILYVKKRNARLCIALCTLIFETFSCISFIVMFCIFYYSILPRVCRQAPCNSAHNIVRT